jgi:hypothetical protein
MEGKFFEKGKKLATLTAFIGSLLLPQFLAARKSVEKEGISRVLRNELEKNSGFTFDDNRYELLERSDSGYIVSIPGYEVKMPYTASDTAGVQSAIDAFVQQNAQLLQNPDLYVGAWLEKKDGQQYLYLDISRHIAAGGDALDTAMREAQSGGQLAIYDLGAGQSLTVALYLDNKPSIKESKPNEVPPVFIKPKQTGTAASNGGLE